MEKVNGIFDIFRRLISWIANRIRYSELEIQKEYQYFKQSPQARLGDFDKSPQPYRQNPARINCLGPDKIGFTGDLETYKLVRNALLKSGLEYELCYLGTEITTRYRIIHVE